jgi:Type II secretion system protein C
MNPDRAIALALATSLAVVLLLGLWLLHRAPHDAEVPTPVPTAATPAEPLPTATPGLAAPPAAAHGYRLAGTVVGDMTYAIIEDPHGVNQLYRPGQTVPGLGQITAIDADRVMLAGSDSTFALQLAPAPTGTPTVPRIDLSGTHPALLVTPVQRPTRDRSMSESSP